MAELGLVRCSYSFVKAFIFSGLAVVLPLLAYAESIGENRFSMRFTWCAIHHVRLQTTVVYQSTRLPGDIPRRVEELWRKYPSIISPYYARTKSPDHPQAVRIRFCPMCQRLFERDLKRRKDLPKTSNQSLQPTALWRCASMSILISMFSVGAQPRSQSGGSAPSR